MKKTIFILGCGVMQIPALRLALENGWIVCAADGNPHAPGRKYCDEFFHVDLKDVSGLIVAAKRLRQGRGPDGVFTAGTDFSLSTAAVAEAFGLPGHSVEAARRATDKVLMREAFRSAAVPSPPFTEITGNKDYRRQLAEIPGPWVVKPVDSMGARGVIKVEDLNALPTAVDTACSYSQSGRALVEAFMEGPEFSLDALVVKGRLIRCGLADRIIVYPHHFIEIGHTIPSSIASSTVEALWKVFEDGVHALGLTLGAAKADVKLTPCGPMIGEIAARLSGGYMSGWTWPAASGVEPTLGAMRLALGLDVQEMNPTRNLVCAERALLGIDGRVQYLDGRRKAMAIPGVKEVFLRYQPGDSIAFPRNNVEKIANVIAVGVDHAEADKRAMAALQELRLVLEPSETDTGVYLDSSADFPPNAFASGSYFDSLWSKHPPLPSQGCRQEMPQVFIPEDLPTCRDSTGRTMRDALRLMHKERRLNFSDGENNAAEGPMLSDLWKALVRGGIPGLRWFLEKAHS